jgi:hypothetical protein
MKREHFIPIILMTLCLSGPILAGKSSLILHYSSTTLSVVISNGQMAVREIKQEFDNSPSSIPVSVKVKAYTFALSGERLVRLEKMILTNGFMKCKKE